jgi:hypothetical protein
VRGGLRLAHRLEDTVGGAGVELEEAVLLVPEVRVDDGLRHPGDAGDVGDRRRPVALLGHAGGQGPEDAAAALPVVDRGVVGGVHQAVHRGTVTAGGAAVRKFTARGGRVRGPEASPSV